MRLRFTRDAVHDLEDLRDWLLPRSPGGHKRVAAAIRAVLEKLKEMPQSGRPTDHADIREIIEPRHGFVIPYTIRGNVVWALRVYNARRHPLIWTDDGLT